MTVPAAASRVGRVGAATPGEAAAHFARRLAFETDCSDVHHDLALGTAALVVVDARGRDTYDAGHVPGAISLPHHTIGAGGSEDDEDAVAHLPRETLVVTYCAGPHCNAATQAAAKLATLGYSVKEMIGGFDYWVREGYEVARTGSK